MRELAPWMTPSMGNWDVGLGVADHLWTPVARNIQLAGRLTRSSHLRDKYSSQAVLHSFQQLRVKQQPVDLPRLCPRAL
jgi:hypothetical protein